MTSPAPWNSPFSIDEQVSPLFLDPTGKLGYIKIHKCGSNSFANWLRVNQQWERAWPEGTRVKNLNRGRVKTVESPNPDEILIVVRDPAKRYVSGIEQIMGHKFRHDILKTILDFAPEVWTKNWNQHVAPYTWFVERWWQFADRMTFVDIADAHDAFRERGVEMEDRHNNAADPQVREWLTEALSPILPLLPTFYQHDYRLLNERGLYLEQEADPS